MSKIYIASDHGGFQLKESFKQYLKEQATDLGALSLDPADDYPEFAFRLAEQVVADPGAIGLLFCRSGAGMVIAANKVLGARAVEVFSEENATAAVAHNRANIFAFGADYMSQKEALSCLLAILRSQPDPDERHRRRLAQISAYETKQQQK